MKGNIKEIGFRKLVEKVISKKFKGHIVFSCGSAEKKLFFENKFLTGSSSNDPSDYLGQYFINEGIITLDQFNRAYKTELETDVKMGAILKLIGLVPLDKLREALINKIVDTSFIISCWSEGTFSISDEYPLNSSEVDIKMTLDDVFNHLAARQGEFTEIMLMFKSLGEYPGVSILDKDILKLKSLDQQIVNLLSIGKNLKETLQAIPVHFYMVARHFYILFKQGIIIPGKGTAITEPFIFSRMVARSGQEKPEEMQSISGEDTMNIYRLAEEAAGLKQYWKAASYYRILCNINPHNIVFKDALNNAEYNYILHFYREILPPSAKLRKNDGSGEFTDSFEGSIFNLVSKNPIAVREIIAYFIDQNSEVKILNAIERLKSKQYLSEVKE